MAVLRAPRQGGPQAPITRAGLPERPAGTPELRRRFPMRRPSAHFDMALQLHGSGAVVHPWAAAWGVAPARPDLHALPAQASAHA